MTTKTSDKWEENLKVEFQEWADSGLWVDETPEMRTRFIAIGNVSEWWISKIKDLINNKKIWNIKIVKQTDVKQS